MSVEVSPLPYAMDALEPHISGHTLNYHYGKHYHTYVANLQKLITGTDMQDMNVEAIVRASAASGGAVFNNAAQVYNHAFYWDCLSPNGGGEPKGALAKEFAATFGSFDEFKNEFTQKSISLFGSGWAWLAKDKEGKLTIVQESNAGTPLTRDGWQPLLVCDVWEHAYYLDYQNARPKYLDAFWRLVNWERVASLL
ncbi:MAG: superoxide dismutase [Pseudomonadota bacterium]|nr:superoxide dismutase [Pseudomonadota bacterium]